MWMSVSWSSQKINPTIDITLGGVKILTLNVLKSLVVNVNVHLVVILGDRSNY